jgi:Tol biopolymer transport system component
VDRLVIGGSAVPVVEGIWTVGGGLGADFVVSSDGTLVYVPAQAGAQRTLVWVDRRANEQPIGSPLRAYVYPRLSPDSTRIAVAIADQAHDIWIWSVPRQTLERFTFGELFDLHPVWTRDGQRLIWGMVSGTEPPNMYSRAVDGTGSAERIIESASVNYPLAITPDGSQLLFRRDGENTGHDLAIVALSGNKQPAPLIATGFNERNGEISPDGRWLAYESNESGADEIYVRPFPNVEAGRWQISTNGGRQPLWARGGRELFFRTADGALMVVPVESTAKSQSRAFSRGTPVRVFDAKYYVGSAGLVGRTYDVSPDSKQFLMIKTEADANHRVPRPSLIVVQNWVEELKQKVGIP